MEGIPSIFGRVNNGDFWPRPLLALVHATGVHVAPALVARRGELGT